MGVGVNNLAVVRSDAINVGAHHRISLAESPLAQDQVVDDRAAASRAAIATQAAVADRVTVIVAVDNADKGVNPSPTASSAKSRPSRSAKI
jgi:hypothetical protein